MGNKLDLEAAGAVEPVTSFSDVKTTFDNQINVNNSTLTSEGINPATNDNTELEYHTIANIAGGFAGLGVSNTDHKLNRANAVNVNDSTLNANNVNQRLQCTGHTEQK